MTTPLMTRSSEKTVTFRRPFFIAGLDEIFPAGDYGIETEEEFVPGASMPVYRRVATVIRLHSVSGDPSLTRALTVDPDRLEAALARDRLPLPISP
ncbi:MAG: hypothetical protein ACFB13_20675 [Kiloniellaceae bacterium]